GGLTKVGGGQWVLGGANTYSGPTTISGGTLTTDSIANGGAASKIGQSTNAASNLLFQSGSLKYTGIGATTDRLFQMGSSTFTANATIDSSGTGALQFTNTGTIVQSGVTNRTLTLTGNNTANNLIANALADGAGTLLSVAKSGSGRWILSGSNTYTGTTIVNSGTLQFNGANAWETTPGGTGQTNIKQAR